MPKMHYCSLRVPVIKSCICIEKLNYEDDGLPPGYLTTRKPTDHTSYPFSNIFLTICQKNSKGTFFGKGTSNNVFARYQAFEIHRAKAIVLHRTEFIYQQSDLGSYTSVLDSKHQQNNL
ncbi:hypothetical protein VTP01DRAFT_3942 [Rhizomucor pusillus]|uniref:uncharacterized protein n=1 Tax=Rhizomucor pusillus TaxID=4840 RepID=UPI00374278D0